MCGIVGGFGIAPLDFDEERVGRAVDCLAHRGPDERGLYVSTDRRAFLGHRRLSIIDLAGGRQPLEDETGRLRLCYNGEIYNFRALRAELEARGHAFRTHTDGEPALHLYQEDPGAFVERLGGMFALALLDEAAGRLSLARDRHGIKPLYYHASAERVLFASELKALLALLPRRPGLSAAALQHYLRWKYIPAPLTIYDGIFELPPAHVLQVQAAPTGALQADTRRYWSVDYVDGPARDEQEAIDELDALLRRAVAEHLESDVEIGALLSGGVDSSLVVALAAKASPRRIKTFSVGFREPGFDQLPYARRLAETYGTEHHEEYVDVDPRAALPRLVRHFDQPYGDSSALACYYVCRVAARHVKVALTGDGGDETFAGYRRYHDAESGARPGGGAGHRSWAALTYALGGALFSPEAKFLHRVRSAAYPPLDAFLQRELMCTPWLERRLLGPAYRGYAGADLVVQAAAEAAARGGRVADQALATDLATYLPGDILPKVDRTSMAWSLECRPPLLDHRVTEFAARLPLALRIHKGEGKYLLKRVAERHVPHELLYRKKRGFRVPIRRWFKRELLDHAEEMLARGALVERGVLDAAGVRWVLRAQRRPWMNLSSCLWALLLAEYWARTL